MVSRTDEERKDGGIGAETAEGVRYVGVELDHGEVIIFDRDDETAWIHSQTARELGLVD